MAARKGPGPRASGQKQRGGSNAPGRLALTLALAVLISCGAGAPEAAPAAELDFSLQALDGRELGPEHYLGQVLLVEFWATWCTPCRAQAQILEALHGELGGDGDVAFLAISLGEDEQTVREFVEDHPFPYPVLVDPSDTLSPRLGIYALPTVMIVDRSGQISYLRMGLSTGDDLRRALAEVEVGAVEAS